MAQLRVADLVKKSSDAVVLIVISNSAGQETALGSGFLVSADGEIATNYHVIKDAHSAIVKLSNGAFFPVSAVLASDRAKDLAIIKVKGKNLPFLSLAESDKLHVGDRVVAIGSPLGLEGTVSDGIVSALRNDGDKKWIQTTAPVSHGNSGGPLLNMSNRVVGVITWGVQSGQNLNFAAPSDELADLLVTAQHQAKSVASKSDSSISASEAHGQDSGDQDSLPIFKQHRLGETAKQFFSIAKMYNGTLTTDYCASILAEDKNVEKFDKDECRGVTAALHGLNTNASASAASAASFLSANRNFDNSSPRQS